MKKRFKVVDRWDSELGGPGRWLVWDEFRDEGVARYATRWAARDSARYRNWLREEGREVLDQIALLDQAEAHRRLGPVYDFDDFDAADAEADAMAEVTPPGL